MVLTNVNIQFSKEMTKVGPLYASFKLQLSSRKIVDEINYFGLISSMTFLININLKII